ncbi:long-chain fatty acid--CoA ligase [Jiangella rhizosphaerae]|uniref:Long-chain-fatty-acid--CoA ligase n=1 Tax=Jiangella rhizosphaerae TaxID=2293569 RepID=A0A418KQE5_9ACTN|nr:long-chain-fatty-acid--CoA ligase [Jiangella rhizosphaerae]
MTSTMMDVPLQVRRLLEHGATIHGGSRVVTATGTGAGTHETTFADIARGAARLAGALASLGVQPGDRVATFMWNNHRHVEAYFAVPAMGAVLHPLNIRLFPEQIAFTANHAADRVVIVDNSLLPGFAKLLPSLKSVRHVIVAGAADRGVLEGSGVGVHDYETLLAAQPVTYDWPDVDERAAAAMCYTSGTTGHPKGVVYSHRSIYLHALAEALPDVFDLSARDLMLTVVPQFHVLAWGLPYAAFATGTSLAMPDRFLTPEPLAAFIEAARPNKGAGVPTVWVGLLQHVEAHPDADISSLTDLVVGGSAMSEALMRGLDARGITGLHAWGMTEMSPLGTFSRPPAGAKEEDVDGYRLTQGRFAAPVEARLVGPDGDVLDWDGESVGELEVRGPWITGSYYGGGASGGDPGENTTADDEERFDEGWLRTGDVGTITPDGYLRLTDRARDVIKSGGEWISSVELEGHLAAHPAVVEAAVVGVPDEKWGERPLATVVVKEGEQVDVAELRDFLATKVAKWQLPERWAVVPEIPKTSVGKFDKKIIRAAFAHDDLNVTTLG